MKTPKNTEDQSKLILWFAVIVVLTLTLISFIPPFSIGNINITRANLFSNFIKFNDSTTISATSKDLIDTSCLEGVSADIISQINTTGPAPKQASTENVVAEAIETLQTGKDTVMELDSASIGSLEDYSPYGQMSARLAACLMNRSREHCVHIAFLGDSFIEGDILTCDLRTILQQAYGGKGMGYIPFADPCSKSRPTINQSYSGWTTYSLLRKKRVPSEYANEFGVNGYISIPTPGARASFSARKGADIDCSKARILFKNRAAGHMDLIINLTDTIHYDLKVSADLQQVEISANIHNLEVRLPVCDDFIGYGVVFEGNAGIYVDNFALRSHSGLNLVATSKSVNQQLNAIVNLDAIVLEYGLNVMQKNVTDYSFFSNKLQNIINFLHLCFPESIIIVMSVGDIGMNKDGRIITAPSVRPMVASQRQAAINTGVMFWDTFRAMSGEDSMAKLVSRGWAAKDYTHIGFKGGRMLSEKIASSIQGKVTNNQNTI